jgi:thioredoxin reductase
LGAVPKLLEVPGENEKPLFQNFHLPPCDGMQFKNKTVAIIAEAIVHSLKPTIFPTLAQKVYLIVRKTNLEQFSQTTGCHFGPP